MARTREQHLGYLRGIAKDGQETAISVSKIGRDYRISSDFRNHLCHPSVRDIDGVKREAAIVFGMRVEKFEPD